MELGGNIELYGVDDSNDEQLIVIKKVVGHFAKHFTETYPRFEGLRLTFDILDGKHSITAGVQLDEELIENTDSHKNIYFALDAALKGVEEKIEG